MSKRNYSPSRIKFLIKLPRHLDSQKETMNFNCSFQTFSNAKDTSLTKLTRKNIKISNKLVPLKNSSRSPDPRHTNFRHECLKEVPRTPNSRNLVRRRASFRFTPIMIPTDNRLTKNDPKDFSSTFLKKRSNNRIKPLKL